MRSVAVPTNDAILAATPLFSRYSRYSPRVVHSISYLMSPCEAFISSFMLSLQGPHESPSPITSSVTPWQMSLIDLPSSMSDSTAQLSMLMNPGATTIPCASSSVRPRALFRSPIAAMVSPLMPTSPVKAADPEPSMIFPFLMRRSYLSESLHPQIRKRTGRKTFKNLILSKNLCQNWFKKAQTNLKNFTRQTLIFDLMY